MTESSSLLRLLQLASPALPVGGYSYSEGLEALSQQGLLPDAEALGTWLAHGLRYGTVRLEASIVLRVYRAAGGKDREDADQKAIAQKAIDQKAIIYWNQYLSALRDAEEPRQQSWQMGQSLALLLTQLDPAFEPLLPPTPCNFAIAFAVAAAQWHLSPRETVLGYLYSWINTGISAGIKLIPLGQTAGQQLQQGLYPQLEATAEAVLSYPQALNWAEGHWTDDDWSDSGCGDSSPALVSGELVSGELCSWGPSLASMAHETLYSRLFRS